MVNLMVSLTLIIVVCKIEDFTYKKYDHVTDETELYNNNELRYFGHHLFNVQETKENAFISSLYGSSTDVNNS